MKLALLLIPRDRPFRFRVPKVVKPGPNHVRVGLSTESSASTHGLHRRIGLLPQLGGQVTRPACAPGIQSVGVGSQGRSIGLL